jgi:hypothetical protein
MDRVYNPQAPNWWGHCADWAAAAVFEDVAIYPSSEDNIIFRVGDKKGLLSLMHDNDIATRADGSRPEIFHYWLLHYIGDQGKAFVADLDPGEEVWSYPIFKYDMTINRGSDVDSVSVRIFYADDMVHPDFMGTRVLSRTLTYDLTRNAAGEITGGQWTGASDREHPNRLTFPLAQRAKHPYLDYAKVLELAQSKDDFLEDGSNPVAISPGKYNLVLLNEDVYRFFCDVGDTLLLKLEKQTGSSQDIAVLLVDGSGAPLPLGVDSVTGSSPMNVKLTAQNPPYTLHLTQADYTAPNIYTLVVDLKKSFMQQIPFLPKSGMWSGFALTNAEAAEHQGIMLVTYDARGEPIQTLMGPLTLPGGKKELFFFSDLPWRKHEYPSTDRMVLMADRPVNLLNLFGEADYRLGSFVQGENRADRLVIPDTRAPFSMGGSMFGAVINESEHPIPLQARVFTTQGALLNTIETMLEKGEKFPIIPGNAPFSNLSHDGWIEVATSADAIISGFQTLMFNQKLSSIFALPVSAGRKIVPHVAAVSEGWVTTITLINPNDMQNRIVLHPAMAGPQTDRDLEVVLGPFEKKKIVLQDSYEWMAGGSLKRSVIEIAAEHGFAGYYAYVWASGTGDEVGLPLLETMDYRDTLVMPHYPGNRLWWTGVGVFNPASFPQNVLMEPYDNQGVRIDGLVKSITLHPGTYEVMVIGSDTSPLSDEISFVKYVSQEPGGQIGGFYLYGSAVEGMPTAQMLSGANM